MLKVPIYSEIVLARSGPNVRAITMTKPDGLRQASAWTYPAHNQSQNRPIAAFP